MTEGFVRHVIDVPVDPVVIFRALVADRDGGFWLDDSLGETTSYMGVGVPIETSDPFSEFATTDEFPVSRVGWVRYGARSESLGLPVNSDRQPPVQMLAVDLAIEIDHREGRLSVIGRHREATFEALVASVVDLGGLVAPDIQPPVAHRAMWRDSPEKYAGFIESCLGHIHEGDAYQLCLTTRVDVNGDFDLADTYCALRAVAPTRNAAFLRIGDVALLSASPETFLTVRNRQASTSPIKGTRRRSDDPVEDARLQRELAESDKERAENLMIVDLCRNDLSQVCDPGTVTVSSLHEIQTYSTVHQLVSTVTGVLTAGQTPADAARALFPAGSMTGAPKRRAVQILEQLETGERGMYSGVYGFAGAGNLSLAMTIRSIIIDPNGAHIGVGGGITSGSDPASEIAEVGIKASALLGVLGATPNPFLDTE